MIASTTAGKVQGIERDGVVQLRGIPFARAERFGAPQPAEEWTDVRECAAFGSIAPQNPSPLETMLGAGSAPTSEDCLSLNVFTPALDDAARPVLVWIHGGGFTAGAGSIPWYSGSRLARQGEVVVVTINYRLGSFGFLDVEPLLGPDFAGSGNNGIRDQIAALHWVRDNIAGFGGDPGKVTVFGESAGGMSVATLLGTPDAAGLFRSAIAQSGAAEVVLAPDAAATIAERFVAETGLTAATAGELLTLPMQALLDAQQSLSTKLAKEGEHFLPFAPVVDGTVLPEPPLNAIRRGSAAGVSLLTGTTSDEWNLFHVMARANGRMDDDGLRRRVKRAVGAELADELIATYRAGRPDQSADDLWCAMATDRVFRVPCTRLAEAQSAHQPATFVYEFSYRSTAFGGDMGACHAIDVPFVFDNVDRRGVEFLLGGVDDRARELSHVTSRAWTAMATNGSPHHDELPDWPAYTPTSRNVMELGVTRTVHDAPRDAERAVWPIPATS
ncbi:MAG: para-nitrobenzyl esterase [Acidimicrobiaceae bacterium]